MQGLSSQNSITKFSISPNLPRVFANECKNLKDPFQLTQPQVILAEYTEERSLKPQQRLQILPRIHYTSNGKLNLFMMLLRTSEDES